LTSTCGFVDAELVVCDHCGALLRGIFFHHSDTADIPSIDYDEVWGSSAAGRSLDPSAAAALPHRSIPWADTLVGLIPNVRSI